MTLKSFSDRRRSLLLRDEAKLNEIVEKIKKFDKKSINKSETEVELENKEKSHESKPEKKAEERGDKKIEDKNVLKTAENKTAETETKKEIESEAFARTMLGKIQGTQLNVLGRKVNAFMGVPYAQPPTDSLRFTRPLPVTSWNETFDATKFGSACVQHIEKNSTSGLQISEECLNLNVWAPSKRKSDLPVMFFIHGKFLQLCSLRILD